MAHFKCEKCGSTEFDMQDGVTVCRTCGAHYQMEETKSAAKSEPEQPPAEESEPEQLPAEESQPEQPPTAEMPIWANAANEVSDSDTDTDESGSSRYALAKSPKSWLATLLLCIFLGPLGVHRFYVGKIGTGIIWLCSHGVFDVGWITDIVMIVIGTFTDKQGRPIMRKHK